MCRWRFRLGLLPLVAACAWAAGGLERVTVVRVTPRPARITVRTGHELPAGTRLLLVSGTRPLGWADLTQRSADQAVFTATGDVQVETHGGELQGWLVPPDYVAGLLERWPTDAELYAEVDSLGPGGRTAWLRAGSNQGVRVGDCWWLRIGGQPAARCDVLFVDGEVCYSAVVPLARDFVLREGQRLTLWPTPGQRREGRVYSAVAYVELRGTGFLAWVAAPPGADYPPEPHLDFFHERVCAGYGVVERRDERFWYVRFNPLRRTVADVPTTGPAVPLRVGDRVAVRTSAEIATGRLAARVFELTPTGAAITAGENDQLAPGQHLTVYRAGRPHGRVVVRQTQRSYAVVTPAEELRDPPLVLQIGDELRLRPPDPDPVPCGRIVTVVDRTLFTAYLTAVPALQTPLGVRLADGTIGVAILVQATDGVAAGFALPCSLSGPLESGAVLLGPSDAAPASAN